MQTTGIIFKQYAVNLAWNLLKFWWKIIIIMNVEHDSIIGMATHCSWTVQGSNPGGGEIFHTCPDLPWGPSSLLFNWYLVSFSGLKWPGQDTDHPFPSSTEITETVQLYLHPQLNLFTNILHTVLISFWSAAIQYSPWETFWNNFMEHATVHMSGSPSLYPVPVGAFCCTVRLNK